MATTGQIFRLAAVGLLGLGVAIQIACLALPTWSTFTFHGVGGENELGPYRIRILKNGTVVAETWEQLDVTLPIVVILTRICSTLGVIICCCSLLVEAYLALRVLGSGASPGRTDSEGDKGQGYMAGVPRQPAAMAAEMSRRLGVREDWLWRYIVFSRVCWAGFSLALIGAILWIRLHYMLNEPFGSDSKESLGFGYAVFLMLGGAMVTMAGMITTKLWMRCA